MQPYYRFHSTPNAINNEVRDVDPGTLSALRSLVAAFSNGGGAFATPVSTIAIGHELRRRNHPGNVPDGLRLLHQVRDVQRLPQGFWIPTPTHVAESARFRIVISCLRTDALSQRFGGPISDLGASRIYPAQGGSELSIPQTSIDEWIAAPSSTTQWLSKLIAGANYFAPHGVEGMELYRHWKSPNPRRWLPADSKLPHQSSHILGRHRGITGQTNHYLFQAQHGVLEWMAELPHDADIVLRIQFGLRATASDHARFDIDLSDTTGVVQLNSPVLPSSERRLLAALGNIRTDRSAATMHVIVPEYTTTQIQATLNALGLLQSGQAA